MRKVILALAFIVCMAFPVASFQLNTEPLGWYGWAWGTTVKDVKGWLNYKGQLVLPSIGPIAQMAYTRQGQRNAYFGKEWLDTIYLFEKDRLCAVMLVTADPTDIGRAIANYGKEVASNEAKQHMASYGKGGGEVFGRASEESRSMVFYYAQAKGAFSSLLYISEPVLFNQPRQAFRVKHYLIIGEKRVVDDWINKVAEGL